MKPLLITTISGIFTLIGIIPTYFNIKDKDNLINRTLSFSAGVMITLSISLLIESISMLNNILLVLIYFLLGIFISRTISNIIDNRTNNNLYKIGITSFIVLLLHNIPEGIITFISTNSNIKIGLLMAIGIAIHNIPEGVSIAIPIYYSGKTHLQVFMITLIAAIAEPFGGVISLILFRSIISSYVLGVLSSITGGVMFDISIEELLTYSRKDTIKSFLLGVIIMLLCIFYFNM